MKKFLINRSREDGFTLIELLVVVIIIAILAAIAVPVYIGIQNNAKRSSLQSDAATTKLNVAAVIAEDGTVASATYDAAAASPTKKAGTADILNSASPKDEVVEVKVGADNQYTVTASSASLKYATRYSSATGQSTDVAYSEILAAAAPAAFQGFEGTSADTMNYYTNMATTTEAARTGTTALTCTSNFGCNISAYMRNMTVGQSYTLTWYGRSKSDTEFFQSKYQYTVLSNPYQNTNLNDKTIPSAWTAESVTFTATNKDANFEIYVRANTGSYFDDFTLRKN